MPHLRVDALRRVNGWDAWNVTEDADLGARLARFGYTVETLRATTHEEAPFKLATWLGQRRRWLKGYAQTLVVHLRAPGRLARDLGSRSATALVVMLAGTLAGALFGPVYLVASVWSLVSGLLFRFDDPLSTALDALGVVVIVVGTASVLVPAVLGMVRRGRIDPVALALMPVYYVFVSLAAWQALWQLWRRPFAWTKTPHGRSHRRTVRGPLA